MTNELKCPVCREKAYEDDEGLMSCSNVNCNYIDDMYISDFKDFVTLIQLRIDKEKAAAVKVAVQQERERVEALVESEITECEGGAEHHEIELYKEAYRIAGNSLKRIRKRINLT